MSCQTLVAKLDMIREETAITSPTGPQYGRSLGYRVNKVNVSGIMRYITPFNVVPTVAMEPGETEMNGEEGEVV